MPRPFPDPHTLRSIVELASTAPSIHNTQPWRWRVDGSQLHLHADLTRQLVQADRDRRELVISCGASLHTVQVAAAADGWAATVTRLPDLAADGHLATVTFRRHEVLPSDTARAEAARRRQTDRRQVSSWPVPGSRFERMRRIAAEYGVLATGDLSDPEREVLHAALVRAAREQSMSEAYLDELLAWTQPRTADGVPPTNLLEREAPERQGETPTRFPAGSLPDAGAEDRGDDGDAPPQWLVLATSGDDPLSWLRAGEALSAVWLHCTEEGLAVVPHSQPIEVETVRLGLQRDLLRDRGCPQVVLRVGWPSMSREAVPATPRRPVDQILEM